MGVQQTSIFEFMYDDFVINKPIRLIELFSGIGAQAKALEMLGADFEHWKTCDWAVPSIHAYAAIHGFHLGCDESTDFYKLERDIREDLVHGVSTNYNEPLSDKQISKKSDEWINSTIDAIYKTNNLVNIMDVHAEDLEIRETDRYCYVMTYSFPCQDLSLAGNKKGMEVSQADGGTRSGLLWEVERILSECATDGHLPQVLIMENVPEVVGVKNIKAFQKWRARLEEFGYSNYCEILNAKEYGIPQNRRRCFMVSILGEYNFTFPRKRKLATTLSDFLEKDVDSKYYLSKEFISYLVNEDTGKYKRKKAFEYSINQVNNVGCAVGLTTRQGRGACDNYVVVNSKTLKIRNDTKQGYIEAELGDGVDISTRMHHHRGTVQKGSSQTLTCMGGENVGVVDKNLLIRKLTPLECLKLMGFEEYDYHCLREIGQSDAQIYHEAGDSIVTTVLMSIFGKLLDLPYEGIVDEYVESLKTSSCAK